MALRRVAQHLLEGGPQTAVGLAQALGMTATAARKHLDALEAAGLVQDFSEAPYGPRSLSPRGRGRPAKVFALTATGREIFEQPYDSIATEAVKFIEQQLGSEGVREFAQARFATIMSEVMGDSDSVSPEELAQRLTDAGFNASLRQAPFGDGVQLCQNACPISHVAAEFPQFCEVETEAIAAAVGVHVTRLSTIASGSSLCTTHVPNTTPGRSA